jgi:hypothetical protein
MRRGQRHGSLRSHSRLSRPDILLFTFLIIGQEEKYSELNGSKHDSILGNVP